SSYREVSKRLEHQRELAATALFRQAECLRKLERLDEAAETYNHVLRHYSDLERITRLSRENLLAMGQGEMQTIDPALKDLDENRSKEIMRIQRIISESPDLLNTPSGE